MCYSAMVLADLRRLERSFDAAIDVDAYLALVEARMAHGRVRIPKAMDDALLALDGPLAERVRDWRDRQCTDLLRQRAEQDARLQRARDRLAVRETKTARNEVRVASNRIAQYGRLLDDLDRRQPAARDARIWPGDQCSLVLVDGQRLLRPMRYQCRMPGWTAQTERQFPGTYNARRDKLHTSWRQLFGRQHALLVVERFYERVERDGVSVELEFVPRTREPMLVPCLWSFDPREALHSFAAITDEPEPEVAAAGHDRTIIDIRPEHVDAWLQPGGDLARMQAILDDRRHPYYEHRPVDAATTAPAETVDAAEA
jgi:putative SOS response-associated peptidase YedK